MLGSLVEYLATGVERLRPTGSLASRTAKSGVWMTATNVVQRGLEITMWLVVARLLGPEEIGLMGIALITLKALQRFSQLGIKAALIQREEDDVDRFMDTAWAMQLGRGVVIAGITFVAAPLLATMFNEPRVTDLLRVIAISPLLVGAINPGIVYFRKRLQFHRHFAYAVSNNVIRFVVAITLAFVLGNVWAIVFAHLASSVAKVVMSYILHPYRPGLELSLERAKELIAYGKWITGSGIIYFLINDGDDFVVGALLTTTSLGFYQLAYRLANAPATEITQVISGVIFPTYSKLQNDLHRFRETYYTILRVTSFVSFPAAVGIIVVSQPFILAILGPEWLPMNTTLQLIAVYGFLFSVASTLGPVWNALGRPDIGTKIGVVRLIVIAVLIFPATMRYGIEGTAAVVIVAYVFPTMPMDYYLLTSLIGATYRRIARELAYPFVASLGMGVVVVTIRESIELGSVLVELLALIVSGVVVYVGFVLLLERLLNWGLEPTLRMIYREVVSDSPS